VPPLAVVAVTTEWQGVAGTAALALGSYWHFQRKRRGSLGHYLHWGDTGEDLLRKMSTTRNIVRINEEELRLGLDGASSWHAQYASSAWVFVGGLAPELTEGDVLCVLSQWGEVEDLHLVREEATGRSKGFAFLKYEDARSAVLAVDNMVGTKLCGRALGVDHKLNYEPPKAKGEVAVEREALAAGLVLPARPMEPGHAYAKRQVFGEHSIAQGVNVFAAPPPQPPPPRPSRFTSGNGLEAAAGHVVQQQGSQRQLPEGLEAVGGMREEGGQGEREHRERKRHRSRSRSRGGRERHRQDGDDRERKERRGHRSRSRSRDGERHRQDGDDRERKERRGHRSRSRDRGGERHRQEGGDRERKERRGHRSRSRSRDGERRERHERRHRRGRSRSREREQRRSAERLQGDGRGGK
jgi:RNA-binding motif X-linked protein 2